jgi:hypothetical protein
MNKYPQNLAPEQIPPALRDLVLRSARMLLSGDGPQNSTLRNQLDDSELSRVELTGVGVFAYFAVPESSPRIPAGRLIGGDISIDVEGVECGAGGHICVRDGAVEFLEIYTYGGESWPDEPRVSSLDLRLSLHDGG